MVRRGLEPNPFIATQLKRYTCRSGQLIVPMIHTHTHREREREVLESGDQTRERVGDAS